MRMGICMCRYLNHHSDGCSACQAEQGNFESFCSGCASNCVFPRVVSEIYFSGACLQELSLRKLKLIKMLHVVAIMLLPVI